MNHINKNIIELFYNFLQNIDNYSLNQCSKYLNKIISDKYTKQYTLKTTLTNKINKDNVTNFLYLFFKHICKYSQFDNQLWIFEDHKWIKFYRSYNFFVTCIRNKFNMSYDIFNENNEIIMNDILYDVAMELYEMFKKNIEYPTQASLSRAEYINIKKSYLKINKEIFINNLDKKTNLICFLNGVYDLNNNNFRIGFPSDYISLSVSYNYNNEYSEKKNDLLNFLQTIQPDETLRNNLLEETAECLWCKESKVLILVGNCESIEMYIELISNTFYSYCISVYDDSIMDYLSNKYLLNKRIIIIKNVGKNIKISTKKFNRLFKKQILVNISNNELLESKKICKTILNYKYTPVINEKYKKRTCCIEFKEVDMSKHNLWYNNIYTSWRLDFMLLLIDIYNRKFK